MRGLSPRAARPIYEPIVISDLVDKSFVSIDAALFSKGLGAKGVARDPEKRRIFHQPYVSDRRHPR